MGKVFQHATSVWTYLGPREEADDEALDLMTRICNHFESLSRTRPELAWVLEKGQAFSAVSYGKYARMTAENIESDIWFPENLFEGEGSILFRNLYKIISGLWTDRLWLFQENVLNEDLAFFRGHRMLRLEAIKLICNASWFSLVPYQRAALAILTMIETHLAQRHRDERVWNLSL